MPNSAVDWASDIALKYNARLILPHVITEDRLATFPKTFALSERDHRQGIGANPAEHLVEAARNSRSHPRRQARRDVCAEENPA